MAPKLKKVKRAIQVKVEDAVKNIQRALRAKLVVMLQGQPGIGKSAIIQAIANKFNLLVVDIRLAQCDPTDLNGFPVIYDKVDNEGNVIKKIASYAPMSIFPVEGDPLPNNPETGQPYAGWLLFFDEFNSAAKAVQAASYKIVLDHAIGQYKLHPLAFKICAGNLASDQAIVNRLSTAMQSRLIHLELVTDVAQWVNWASRNHLDHRVITYIENRPDNLHNFDPNHNDLTFACPRTWEFVSRIIKGNKSPLDDYLSILSGTVSEAIAREFIVSTKIYKSIPTFADIHANPDTCEIPKDPSMCYAVAHLIAAHASPGNIEHILPYIKRLPIEFETITLQNICQREPAIADMECISEWMSTKGREIFS
jgi:hypothetical protein